VDWFLGWNFTMSIYNHRFYSLIKAQQLFLVTALKHFNQAELTGLQDHFLESYQSIMPQGRSRGAEYIEPCGYYETFCLQGLYFKVMGHLY